MGAEPPVPLGEAPPFLQPRLNGFAEEERRVPTLQHWTALATDLADRWEVEIAQRERANSLDPDWADEIVSTGIEIIDKAGDVLEVALGVETSSEALALFRALERLNEVVSRVRAEPADLVARRREQLRKFEATRKLIEQSGEAS